MIESLIVKKLAANRFRYFFAITAPKDTPLTGRLSVRVYPKGLALLGTTNQFDLTLQPGQRSSFSVESNYLFKKPHFDYTLDKLTGKGEVSPKREDLSA